MQLHSKVKGKIISEAFLRDRWDLLHTEKRSLRICTRILRRRLSQRWEKQYGSHLGGKTRSRRVMGQLTIGLAGCIDTIEG